MSNPLSSPPKKETKEPVFPEKNNPSWPVLRGEPSPKNGRVLDLVESRVSEGALRLQVKPPIEGMHRLRKFVLGTFDNQRGNGCVSK